MDSLWIVIPIVILLLLSAFFGGAETALTAVSQPRMFELERQGNRRAAIVNALRHNRERMIGAVLTAQNIVGPLASVLTTSLFIAWFGAAGAAYATIVLSVVFIVFGEVLPKTYAIYAPDRTALAIAPVIRFVVQALAPLTAAVEWVVRQVLRLLGLHAQPLSTSEDELRGVISLHRGADPEVKAEREMLHSILDLGDISVSEVMTHRSGTTMIDIDRSAQVIVRQVLASPYSRLPVYRGNPENIIGVLHSKDLLRALHRGREGEAALDIAAILTAPWFIPESSTLLEQLREFRRRREHFALVVDEYGSFEGVLTLEDILEEIVGKIGERAPDQVEPAPGIRAAADGSFIVNGDITVRDLNRELDWDLPDDRAATVAGLVMHEARRIPEVRQVFAFFGYRFEILRRKNNRITALRISPIGGGPRKQARAPAAPPPAAQPSTGPAGEVTPQG
jgi:Mg2+/Co2+ transporter CorB